MRDMVKELREHADEFNKDGPRDNPTAYPDLYREAADEIERLKAENEKLKAAASWPAMMDRLGIPTYPKTETKKCDGCGVVITGADHLGGKVYCQTCVEGLVNTVPQRSSPGG